jgi:FemAB-related protein (PEP-CTERM system-associated)
MLALTYVQSALFGRFLVSLPYLNYGGVLADDPQTAQQLIDRAVKLADEFDVRYLELRHETAVPHPSLPHQISARVNMQRPLPSVPEELWAELPCKVRNQVRKAEKHSLTVSWGGEDLLPQFYSVFSHNMRDLGTPVYSCQLFQNMFRGFPDRVEFCVVRLVNKPVAAAVLMHGWGVTEVPSAGSLRRFNQTCANMLMYWHLLKRAIERSQTHFDFGRCSLDGSTYRFKKQWGASPLSTQWQYHLRRGELGGLNPSTLRYQKYIRWWRRLPIGVTRFIGPRIVRGIP